MKAPDVKVKVEWTERATKPEIGKAFDIGAAIGFIIGAVCMACVWAAAK